MRYNVTEMIEFSYKEGDHEGRMTHKPPSKSIYDSSFKERWFKLKGNLLFYYRLNDEGGVEKNEPNGVFVLENITIEREREDLKFLYGFAITWKDDPFRKHCFYTLSENLLQRWITKLVGASYENLRAELLVLRLQIRQKSGKDPLEHFGTPLPIHTGRGGVLAAPSKAMPSCRHPNLTSSSSDLGLASHRDSGRELLRLSDISLAAKSAPNTPSVPTKFEVNNVPKPPPRTNRSRHKGGSEDKNGAKQIGPNGTTFKSHINGPTEKKPPGSFRSHVKLSEEEVQEFLK